MRSTTVAISAFVSMAAATPQNFGLQGLDLGSTQNFGLEGLDLQQGLDLGKAQIRGLQGLDLGLQGLDFGLKGEDSFGLGGFSTIGEQIEESKRNNFKSFGNGDFYGPTDKNVLKESVEGLKNLKSLNFGTASDFGFGN